MSELNAAQESAQDTSIITSGEDQPIIKAVEENPEAKELPQVSEAAAKALQKGWQTKEDWTAAGKDPEEWISATHFNKNGDIFKQMQVLKNGQKNQDKRISDNNAYWQAQLATQKQSLEAAKEVAIEDSDKAAVKKIDKELAANEQQSNQLNESAKPEQAAPEDLQIENNYFNDLKQGHVGYAQQAAAHFINSQSLSGQELVDAVEAEVNKQYNITKAPAKNERREKASVTDGKKSTASKSDKITVDNLTAEDRASIQSLKNVSVKYANKSDAEMIKILNDVKL